MRAVSTDLIPTAEAAALAGVNVRTINRWVTDGKLTPALEGPGLRGSRWFRRSDVLALAEGQPEQDGAA